MSVRVRWCRPQRYYDLAPWRGTFTLDGGCLTNQGIHHIDLMRYFVGEVDKVKLLYQLPEKVVAPVEKGSMLGTLELRIDGKTLRQIPLVAAEEVPTQSFFASVAESIFGWSEMND